MLEYPPNLPDRAQRVVVTRNESAIHAYGPAVAFLKSNKRPILIPVEWAWYQPVTGKGGERQISHALFNGADGYYVRFGEAETEFFLMRESDLHLRIDFVASRKWYDQLHAIPFRVYRVPGGAVVLRSSTHKSMPGGDWDLGDPQELCGHRLATEPLAETLKDSHPQNIDDVCEEAGHCVILGLAKLLQWTVPHYYERVEGHPSFSAVEDIRAIVQTQPHLTSVHLNLRPDLALRSIDIPDSFPKHLRLDWGKVLFNVRLRDGNIQHYIAVDFDRKEAVDAAHKGRIAFTNISEVMDALNIDSFLHTWRIVEKYNPTTAKRKSDV